MTNRTALGNTAMITETGLARRPDGTVATEHHARLSRAHRSQVVLGGAMAFFRSVLRAFAGRAGAQVGGTATPASH